MEICLLPVSTLSCSAAAKARRRSGNRANLRQGRVFGVYICITGHPCQSRRGRAGFTHSSSHHMDVGGTKLMEPNFIQLLVERVTPFVSLSSACAEPWFLSRMFAARLQFYRA